MATIDRFMAGVNYSLDKGQNVRDKLERRAMIDREYQARQDAQNREIVGQRYNANSAMLNDKYLYEKYSVKDIGEMLGRVNADGETLGINPIVAQDKSEQYALEDAYNWKLKIHNANSKEEAEYYIGLASQDMLSKWPNYITKKNTESNSLRQQEFGQKAQMREMAAENQALMPVDNTQSKQPEQAQAPKPQWLNEAESGNTEVGLKDNLPTFLTQTTPGYDEVKREIRTELEAKSNGDMKAVNETWNRGLEDGSLDTLINKVLEDRKANTEPDKFFDPVKKSDIPEEFKPMDTKTFAYNFFLPDIPNFEGREKADFENRLENGEWNKVPIQNQIEFAKKAIENRFATPDRMISWLSGNFLTPEKYAENQLKAADDKLALEKFIFEMKDKSEDNQLNRDKLKQTGSIAANRLNAQVEQWSKSNAISQQNADANTARANKPTASGGSGEKQKSNFKPTISMISPLVELGFDRELMKNNEDAYYDAKRLVGKLKSKSYSVGYKGKPASGLTIEGGVIKKGKDSWQQIVDFNKKWMNKPTSDNAIQQQTSDIITEMTGGTKLEDFIKNSPMRDALQKLVNKYGRQSVVDKVKAQGSNVY